MHNELSCITEATAMWTAVLDDAERLAAPDSGGSRDPYDEIRTRLPSLVASCSPAARAVMRDHVDHLTELVAFVHGILPACTQANTSA